MGQVPPRYIAQQTITPQISYTDCRTVPAKPLMFNRNVTGYIRLQWRPLNSRSIDRVAGAATNNGSLVSGFQDSKLQGGYEFMVRTVTPVHALQKITGQKFPVPHQVLWPGQRGIFQQNHGPHAGQDRFQ